MRIIKFAAAAALAGALRTAVSAGIVWDGGGAADRRWSNPLNWSPDGVPAPLSAMTLTSSAFGSTQDLGNLFPVTGLTLTAPHAVSGNPLQVFVDINVTNSALNACMMQCDVDFPSSSTITTPLPSGGDGWFLSLTNTSGAGALNVNGAVMLQGNTTLAGPVNATGRLATIGHVTAQQNYTVASGEFFGAGVMSFSAGKRLDVTGKISPGGAALPFDFGDLRVEGDVRLRGSLEIELLTIAPVRSDHFDVTGTLDMQGSSLSLIASPLPGQYRIGSYGNRIGSLANFRPDVSIVYTSAENAGPGEILIVVPEPSSALAALKMGFCGCALRRQRRRHDTIRA